MRMFGSVYSRVAIYMTSFVANCLNVLSLSCMILHGKERNRASVGLHRTWLT